MTLGRAADQFTEECARRRRIGSRIAYTLTPSGHGTLVALTQDNNPGKDAAVHSAQNWQAMLEGLKRHVENSAPAS